jgi:hypothetical protein
MGVVVYDFFTNSRIDIIRIKNLNVFTSEVNKIQTPTAVNLNFKFSTKVNPVFSSSRFSQSPYYLIDRSP